MSENTINNRIELIMKENKLNYHSFGKKLNISDVVVGNTIKGRNKPSFDFINKLILTFDCINTDWLLTGNGEMLKKDIPIYKVQEKSNCKELELELGYLKKEVKNLNILLAEKDKVIKLLERELTHKKTKKITR